jgi:hypothetical protein
LIYFVATVNLEKVEDVHKVATAYSQTCSFHLLSHLIKPRIKGASSQLNMDVQDGQPEAGPSNHASPTAETPAYPSAPNYAFSSNPSTLLEVNASDLESELVDNFWRSARW